NGDQVGAFDDQWGGNEVEVLDLSSTGDGETGRGDVSLGDRSQRTRDEERASGQRLGDSVRGQRAADCGGRGRWAVTDHAGARALGSENPGLAEQGDQGRRPTEIGAELLCPGVELRRSDAEAEIFDESDIGRQEPVDENRVIGTELDARRRTPCDGN